jgi:lipoprotein signal peptidase
MSTGPDKAPPQGPINWSQEILLLGAVVLLLCAADQWSKGWAVERLGPLKHDWTGRLRPPLDKPPVDVIDNALRFNITGNEGAIWGLGRNLSNRFKRPFFVTMSLLAVAFILLLVRASTPEQRLRRLGLAAVLSGAAGNLIDRIGQDYVVDFIDWHYGYNWPTFNVADMAITIGVVMVIIDLYRHPDPVDDEKGSWWPLGRKQRSSDQDEKAATNVPDATLPDPGDETSH